MVIIVSDNTGSDEIARRNELGEWTGKQAERYRDAERDEYQFFYSVAHGDYIAGLAAFFSAEDRGLKAVLEPFEIAKEVKGRKY